MSAEIESYSTERQIFKPGRNFQKQALISGRQLWEAAIRRAERNPEAFWETAARELLWRKPWKKALQWKPPFARWFVGGKLNASENCLDRHLDGPRRHKVAVFWEGENGERRSYTYWQLHRETALYLF